MPAATRLCMYAPARLDDEADGVAGVRAHRRDRPTPAVGGEHTVTRQPTRVTEHQHDDVALRQAGWRPCASPRRRPGPGDQDVEAVGGRGDDVGPPGRLGVHGDHPFERDAERLAASRPTVGTSIVANHDPAATAGAASVSASDVAAGPEQAEVPSLTRPCSGKSSANASVTGKAVARQRQAPHARPAPRVRSGVRQRVPSAAWYRTLVRDATGR